MIQEPPVVLAPRWSSFHTCFPHTEPHFCITRTGHEIYDDYVKICCNGEIKLRVRDQKCCGDENLYFTTLSICCGGKIEDRFVPPKGSRQRTCSSNDEQCRKQTCCGGVSVDKEDTMCCQQQVIHLNDTQQLERDFLRCCGDTVINTLSYFCCGGKKFLRHSASECCEGKVYDIRSEKCLINFKPHRVVSKYENFCGNQRYDKRNNSCCSGTIQDMPEMDPLNPTERNARFSCCDTIAYDSTTEKCCRESHTGFATHTIPKQPNIYCCGPCCGPQCGHDFYNATHQDCYNGRKLETVFGKVCCGYTYIDGETEKCCGNTVYNAQTHDCCTVKDLIYWRDVKKTGAMLVVILCLALMSVISVVAYLSLLVLTVTFSFVIYKKVMGAVQKSGDGHPFKCILEKDIGLNEDRLKSVIKATLKNVNATLKELRHLFLIEDIVDSVKFGILLWALTYIGSWFSDMTLIIIALVLVFSVPKLYETYQVQIDNYVGLAKAQINNYLSIIQSKVPFLKKKEKTQ